MGHGTEPGRGKGRSLGRGIRARCVALLCAAATTVGGGVLLLGQATPAAADPIGSCTATKGAIVAVDFGDWGGGVVRGCDATPTTGYDLLHEAGFSTKGTEHDGDAFICRLGHAEFDSGKQYPTPDKEACKLTPPATAYWSYWIAPRGQDHWTYSPLGAMSQKPTKGSVEAWVFGGTDVGGTTGKPTFTPAEVRAGGGTDPGEQPPVVKPGKVDLAATHKWLKGRLTGGDHIAREEQPDHQATAQTALALAAAGGRSATLDKVKTYLAHHVEEAAYPQGTDKAPSPAGAALVSLVAASTEGDPRSFGGHDVAGDLAKSVCTQGGTPDCGVKGDFPGVGDVETQALAVLALRRAGVRVPADAVARLAAHQCEDGGFSPTLIGDGTTCVHSDRATTPYATMALKLAGGHKDAVARARKTLRKSQLPTGGFGAYPGMTTGDIIVTGRSAQALRLLGDAAYADAAASWLSRQQTKAGGFGFDEGATDPEIYPTWSAAVAGARTSLGKLTTKPSRPEPPVDPTDPPGPDPTDPPEPTNPPTTAPKPPWAAGEGPNLKKGTAYLTARSRLKRGDYYENVSGTGFADYGLTIDGAYALAATGTDNDALRGIVDFLDGKGKDGSTPGRTVNDWTGVGTSHAAGGSIGKVAVLAQAVGRDPRDFAGHDLIAALKKSVCKVKSQGADRSCAAKGAYRYAPSVFSQSLAVIAQLRAGQKTAAAAPVTYLRSLQKSTGAWPSLIPPTGDSEVDSTAMAAMALKLDKSPKSEKAVAKALKWIASKQLRGGGFPGASGNSVNSAALAVQGLSLDAPKYRTQIKKARKFLAGQQNSDGGFNVAASGQRGSDVRASTQALGGAIGTSFGTLVRDLDGTKPQPPTNPAGGPGGSGGSGGSPNGGGAPDIVTPGDGGSAAGDTPTGPLASTGVQVGGLALAAVALCFAGWRTLAVARRRTAVGGRP
ncbi:prenyltransferase/squalene oxidase repeat-containing protein [Streptomyces lasiicapitis]|uniref:prenyltransferase/squalene oxidase repeat-containing protein n=1 Tax=Streptomyces lasiicapitis TaxID=1923961 RepID=UPI0035716181